jgi:hypothetical protein
MRHVRDVIRMKSAGMATREIARRVGAPKPIDASYPYSIIPALRSPVQGRRDEPGDDAVAFKAIENPL